MLKRLAIFLAGIASVFAVAIPAQANTVQIPAHSNVCPYYGYCAYTQTNANGSQRFWSRSDVGENLWFNMWDSNTHHPQSVRNHDATDMWVRSNTLNEFGCVKPGQLMNTYGSYGYGYFLTGHTNCTENPPPGHP